MPHDDDTEYNDAYLDDDEPTASTANLDVALPTPLQSAKIAQSAQNQPPESKDRPRKSRFSDINDLEANKDTDMRVLPPMSPAHNADNFGNGRPNEIKNNFQDIDYRNTNFDKPDDMYDKDEHFDQSRPMDVDLRNRFDNYDNGDSPAFGNNNFNERETWNQNENFPKQNNANAQGEGFGFRGNQNGSFGANGPIGKYIYLFKR